MIRLLIIGRDAVEWGEGLEAWEGEAFEVHTEELPAAGIRDFGESSPDAVAIAEPDSSPRIEAIVKAIEDRPLGRIVPIVLLGASYRGDEELPITDELEASVGAEGLIDRLEQHLEIELERTPYHAATSSEADLQVGGEESEGEEPTYHSTEIPTMDGEEPSSDEEWARNVSAGHKRAEVESRVERPDYVIERVDGGADGNVGAESGLEGSGPDAPPEPAADGEGIHRKVTQVRHEDYFTILEVDPTVDTKGVRRAYRRQKQRFRRDRLPGELVEQYEGELAEIHDGLDDARAVLGDESLREAYRSETARS